MTQIAVIIADSEIDLLCEWDQHAVDHVADLKAAGHKVKRRLFPSWVAAEAFEDRYNGNTAGILWLAELEAEDADEVVSSVVRFGAL